MHRPPSEPSQVWGGRRMARRAINSWHLRVTLRTTSPPCCPVVQVGATGAMIWCYADYVPELYNRRRAPIRSTKAFLRVNCGDGSLQPHAG